MFFLITTTPFSPVSSEGLSGSKEPDLTPDLRGGSFAPSGIRGLPIPHEDEAKNPVDGATPVWRRVHDAHDPGVLDSTTHALPVQFEVSNPANQLLVGQSGTALLYQREQLRVPAAPKSAILTEAGRPYVFVQTSGEAFARRFIEIAARDGDLVGIKSGVQPGDRVVTLGAYEIQLASAAKGLPAEGHVH